MKHTLITALVCLASLAGLTASGAQASTYVPGFGVPYNSDEAPSQKEAQPVKPDVTPAQQRANGGGGRDLAQPNTDSPVPGGARVVIDKLGYTVELKVTEKAPGRAVGGPRQLGPRTCRLLRDRRQRA
jgi:hypothetical protein